MGKICNTSLCSKTTVEMWRRRRKGLHGLRSGCQVGQPPCTTVGHQPRTSRHTNGATTTVGVAVGGSRQRTRAGLHPRLGGEPELGSSRSSSRGGGLLCEEKMRGEKDSLRDILSWALASPVTWAYPSFSEKIFFLKKKVGIFLNVFRKLSFFKTFLEKVFFVK